MLAKKGLTEPRGEFLRPPPLPIDILDSPGPQPLGKNAALSPQRSARFAIRFLTYRRRHAMIYIGIPIYKEESAVIDHLPGIMVRGEFKDSLKKTIGAEETLTVGMLDVDQFMEINEQVGDEAGDRLLLLLAEALRESAEANGWTVGRIGGDEFAIAMPGVSLEKGFLQMEALRMELVRRAAAAFPDFQATFSIGVANVPRDAKDVTALMRQAEHALYQVKEAGRNAVGLPTREEMVLRSCYYNTAQLGRLKKLAEQLKKKESVLLREALDDLLRKYDVK